MPYACLPRSPHKALRLALHGAHGNVLKAGIDTSSGYDLVRDLVVSSQHAILLSEEREDSEEWENGRAHQ